MQTFTYEECDRLWGVFYDCQQVMKDEGKESLAAFFERERKRVIHEKWAIVRREKPHLFRRTI